MDELSKEIPVTSGQFAILEKVFRIIADIVPSDSKLYLFGSFARGEQQISSDIDVAIDAHEPLFRLKLVEILDTLEESNIPYAVDVVDLHDVSKLQQITEEGIEWV